MNFSQRACIPTPAPSPYIFRNQWRPGYPSNHSTRYFSSGSRHASSRSELLTRWEYIAFLFLFSLCYFLLFSSHQATAATLRSGLPCAKDMMKERILTFRKSQELLSQDLQRLGLYLQFQLQHFCCWWCQTMQNLIIG